MLIGYARTSTAEQVAGLEAQVRDLKAHGCEKVYQEQTSSVGKREELEKALEYVRENDTLVVTKLDRLARSVSHFDTLRQQMDAKGVGLRILSIGGQDKRGVDTKSPTDSLILNLLMSVAQFEREIMLERQREGIAQAKAKGKYTGRKPTARARTADVLALKEEGVGPTEIAKRLNIGRASVYRILRDPDSG